MSNPLRVNVTATATLSPNLRRISIGGEALRTWASSGKPDEFIRITIPDPEQAPGWENLTENARIYTVRRWDPMSLTIDIDVVIHGPGRGSTWGMTAAPGDSVAINEPRGYYDPPADTTRRLLIADATGLPAIARILEEARSDETFQVFVELVTAQDLIALPSPAHVTVQWQVSGNGRGPSALLSAMHSTTPTDDTYLWVACETATTRAARTYVRNNWARDHSLYTIVGYWHADPHDLARTWEQMTRHQREQYLLSWNQPKPDQVTWRQPDSGSRPAGLSDHSPVAHHH